MKKTGEKVAIRFLAVAGFFVQSLFVRKKKKIQRSDMEQIVFDLEQRLRQIKIELLRARELPPGRLRELRSNENKLQTEIYALKNALRAEAAE